MGDKLSNLLKYVEDNNIFYKERFNNAGVSFCQNNENWYKNYQKLPILNKSEIVRNYEKIISCNYNIDQLERQQTSGSTGEPLWIYKTESEINRQSSYIWRYRMKVANVFALKMENTSSTSIVWKWNIKKVKPLVI